MASARAAGGAAVHSVVVHDEGTDPAPPDSAPAASAMTFNAPVADDSLPLDHVLPASGEDVSEHSTGAAEHCSSLDFATTSEPVALYPFVDDDTEEWPALRSTPWIPPIIGAPADRPEAADQD
ncbi:hypothetical protein CYMTET_26272 [Cymbomonas tetramitiformis]|uniref:Uncharacterized protein n=1 Tax=Cymbomonas tetramitiformis TaxID=36881 RepID=A0AAE0FSP2_9CHLO|nr:hypothetical protein CYMTET_26272 [Cymbomonas tetramitiformis]